MGDPARKFLVASLLTGSIAASVGWSAVAALAEEPPAINPFGKSSQSAPSDRDDLLPGYVEMSDGSIHAGMLTLTRDKRLQVMDEKLQRQREVPLEAVEKIECRVKKEWMEKEWKFKETTSDEKLFTGRSYPAREYVHLITLKDGRTIEGALSGILYVQPQTEDAKTPSGPGPQVEPLKFLLHKRDKGEAGETLESLRYVKFVRLGDAAYKEGRQKAEKVQESEAKPPKPAKGKTAAAHSP